MSSHGLLNDVLFKIVFGGRQSEHVLAALLNALLGYSDDESIVSLTIANPNLEREHLTDKGAVLDLKAVDAAGRWFNIEVQLEPGGPLDYHPKRTIFYTAKLLSAQMEQGVSYANLAKTVHISLLDFVLFKDSEKLHSVFALREAELGFLLSDVLELHYIELPKFSLTKPQELHTPFERWLHVLRFSVLYLAPDSDPLPATLQQEEGILMAIESLRKAYARDDVRELIEAREKARMDYGSAIAEATSQGLQQGLQQGRQEGRQEGHIDVARKMLALGLDRAAISQTTGLTEAQLAELAEG